MVVTRSMSGATKKADTKVAVNHKVAERAGKKTSPGRERARKKVAERAGKETFVPQYLKNHPGAKNDFSMVVTRSVSGATKKADTKVAVNHKVAERASKKTTAERQSAIKKTTAKRARKDSTAAGTVLNCKAFDLFMFKTYFPQYYERHPDVKVGVIKNMEVSEYGYAEWMSMTDSDKAPYVAMFKKMRDEKKAEVEDYFKALVRDLSLVYLRLSVSTFNDLGTVN